jgi:hypothetical protein
VKCEPGQKIIGDVIEEDEPQRQPATRVEPQITAISVDVKGRKVGSAGK